MLSSSTIDSRFQQWKNVGFLLIKKTKIPSDNRTIYQKRVQRNGSNPLV
jgi:hypothetical protein